MPLAVISVPNGLPVSAAPAPFGLPVIVSTNGFGMGVTPVALGGRPVADVSGTLFGPAIIPANLTPPVISGTPQVGQTLTTSSGTWSGTTATFTYQWKRGGVNIAGATSSVYLLVSADLGANITVTVTATNPAGSASATSAAVGPVVAAPVAPANTVLPVITGTLTVGNVLTVTTGTWTGTPTITYSYQWKSGGTNVGSNATTYTTVSGDVGANISCVVTATNAVGSSSATAAAVGPISLVGTPTIDLVAAVDLGVSATDNITCINLPQFDIICSTTPVAGDIIDIAKDGVIVTSVTLLATDIAGTTAPGLGVPAVPDGTYAFTARHSNTAGSSPYSAALSVTVDTVAAVLSSPTAVQNSTTQSAADLSVTSNKAQGTLYFVVQPAAMAAPTAAQIIAGLGSDNLYPPAGRSGSLVNPLVGVNFANATGFSTSGSFKVYWSQTDTAGNSAAVVSATWTQTIVSFTANGVGGFDGSTTYLSNTTLANSIAAGQKGLVSFWVKVLGGLGTDRYLFEIFTGTTIKFWIHFTTSNVIEVQGRDASGATMLVTTSNSSGNPFASVPTPWVHVAFWWDLSLATPTGAVYLNGTLFTSGTHTWLATNPIAYNQTSAFVGAQHTPSLKFNGSLSELYVNLHETLDLGVTANLQKFIAGSAPVFLGATGSLPTGSAPEFYLGDDNNNTNWQTNNGTKGNFTIPAGALTSVTGPP